ncbi:MAG: RNA methyltransferase [Caldisericia bacterium]|nr:RNA methyltransferase [Caldisericia bacterium]
MRIYIALIHYPVYDINKKIIVSSIVPYDIVDISRAGRTFGVKKYFIVHPFKAQRETIKRIINFWTKERGSFYNEDRKEALKIVSIKRNLNEVIKYIENEEKEKPKIILTSARKFDNNISYRFLKEIIVQYPVLLVFGTGWGIVVDKVKYDYILEPIFGFPKENNYNHLTVRSACSIILDRITQLFSSQSINKNWSSD